MTLVCKERASDSIYVEKIMQGTAVCDGFATRPAENNWHMVFVSYQNQFMPIVVGPLSRAGHVFWKKGAEILWIKFKVGVSMRHLPLKNLRDKETILLPSMFCDLQKSTIDWRQLNFDNADVFTDYLGRTHNLLYDPIIENVLSGHFKKLSPRTIRQKFMESTGLTQGRIRQIEKAKRSADLLLSGKTILDVIHETGYFDQSHFTKSLKQFIGYTPTKIINPEEI